MKLDLHHPFDVALVGRLAGVVHDHQIGSAHHASPSGVIVDFLLYPALPVMGWLGGVLAVFAVHEGQGRRLRLRHVVGYFRLVTAVEAKQLVRLLESLLHAALHQVLIRAAGQRIAQAATAHFAD